MEAALEPLVRLAGVQHLKPERRTQIAAERFSSPYLSNYRASL